MKKRYLLIFILIVITFGILFNYFFSYDQNNIMSPKTTQPTHTYKKDISSKEVIYQMMKDMYPEASITEIEDKRENCETRWCISTSKYTVDNVEYENVYLSKSPKTREEYINKQQYQNWSEEGVNLVISKTNMDIKQINDYKNNVNEQFEKFGKNMTGNQYFIISSNNIFILEGSYARLKSSQVKDEAPVGFKKNLPFKEYFENIEFED